MLRNIIGTLMIIGLGLLCIGLGKRGFTPRGLPLTGDKNITGMPAKIIGVFCIILGVGIIGAYVVALILDNL